MRQIQGTLTTTYTNPFEPTCAKCNHLITSSREVNETMVYCINCKEKQPFIYSNRLNCSIHTKNNTPKNCILKGEQLEKALPDLKKVTCDEYSKDKSTIIVLLASFHVYSTFTLDNSSLECNCAHRIIVLHNHIPKLYITNI